MCTLRELDIKSRGAAALVDEWWEGAHKTVRAIWKLEDIINLLVDATDAALDVQRQTGILDTRPISDPQTWNELISTTSYFLESTGRLRKAAEGVERAIQLFESEGYRVEKSAQLHEAISVLPQIVETSEEFLDRLEWQGLEKELMPTERLMRIGEFLRESGQASA